MLDFLISKVQATNCLFLHASLSCVQFPVHGCLRNTICIGCCGSWETKTGGDWGQPEGRRKGICSIHLGSVLTPSKPRLWKGSSAKAEAGYSGEGEVWVGTLCTARVCVCTCHGYTYRMSSVRQEHVCCSGNQINILLWFNFFSLTSRC